MRLMILVSAATFLLDQATKSAVLYALGLEERGQIDIWPPLLSFRMAWNEGINFGFLGDFGAAARWALIGLALVICAVLVGWAARAGRSWQECVMAGLMVGGALGNVFDRLIYGAVVDFLNMSCCGVQNPYVFNLADVAIFCGAFGIILFTGRSKGDAPPKDTKTS